MIKRALKSDDDKGKSCDYSMLELLKVVIDLAEKESDRTWVRYSMMLYTSTGVLAVLSLTFASKVALANLVPAILGSVIAFAWLKVNQASYYFEHRWHADMEAIIQVDPTLREWIRGRTAPRIKRPFKSRSALIYFNLVPYSFLVLWLLVIAIVILIQLYPSFGDVVRALGTAEQIHP